MIRKDFPIFSDDSNVSEFLEVTEVLEFLDVVDSPENSFLVQVLEDFADSGKDCGTRSARKTTGGLWGYVAVHRLARGRVDLAKHMQQVSPATFNDVFTQRTLTCESIEGSNADSVWITYVGNMSKVLPMEGIQFLTFRFRQSLTTLEKDQLPQ